MESFSIRVGCPDSGQLLDALGPQLDEYCEQEVFEYASGKVMTIALKKFLLRANSNLLAVITMDFTPAGYCQIDIISGGGGDGLMNAKYSLEKSVVSDILQIFIDVCKDKDWNIREDESESSAESD